MEQIHHRSIAKSIVTAAAVCIVLTAVLSAVWDQDGSEADIVPCGSGLYFELTIDYYHILFIDEEGATGEMTDWPQVTDVPWYGGTSYRESFVVDEGTKTFGSKAFQNQSVTYINTPSTLREIRDHAFESAEVNCDLVLQNVSIGDYAFQGAEVQLIKLTDSVTHVSSTAFRYLTGTVVMVMSGDIEINADTLGSGNAVIYVDSHAEIVKDAARVDQTHVRLPTTSDSDGSRWSDGKREYYDGDVVTVTDTTVFTHRWDREITVSFEDTGLEPIESQHINIYSVPVRPADPVKTGYDFRGWTVDGEPYNFDHGFDDDTVVTAQWTRVMVELSWFDTDGAVLYVSEVGSGDIPERPQDPVKQGYAFVGWVTGGELYGFDHGFERDTALIAKWDVLKVQLYWEDGSGSVLYHTQADFGAVPERPADPEREGYDFNGWRVDGAPYNFEHGFSGDTVLTAAWEVMTFEVVWRNYDGSILMTDTVDYGSVPDYEGTVPQKSQTASVVYTFSGWDPVVGKVFSDSEFTAVFSESPRIYQVEFGPSEGVVYSEGTLDVPYGSEIHIHGNELFLDGITVTAVPESSDRTIAGWSVEDGHRILSDLCIMAVYEPLPDPAGSGTSAVMVLVAAAVGTAALQAVLMFRKRAA